jgi:excisionase family DNA binding protein
MLAASDDSEVESATAKGFTTAKGREAAGAARTLANSTRASSDTRISANANRNTNQQPQRIVDDSEFEPLLDVAEAARLLRIHPKTLRVKAAHGIIPGIQIGRVWRFRASTLNRWLEGIAGYGRC